MRPCTGATARLQAFSEEWDYNNKVTGITYPGGGTNSFVTSDLGDRISKTDSGGTTSLLFDGSSVFADSRADYTHGGVTGLISERASGVTKTYHGDQLGSTRGLTNSSQTVTDSREYDSFGLLIASSGTTPTPFGFAGGEGYQRDADSGLMLLGARYYDPSIGRFISRDPIGYQGGLNLYGYCGNDPLNVTDPTGTVGREVFGWLIVLIGIAVIPFVVIGTAPLWVPILIIVIGLAVVAYFYWDHFHHVEHEVKEIAIPYVDRMRQWLEEPNE